MQGVGVSLINSRYMANRSLKSLTLTLILILIVYSQPVSRVFPVGSPDSREWINQGVDYSWFTKELLAPSTPGSQRLPVMNILGNPLGIRELLEGSKTFEFLFRPVYLVLQKLLDEKIRRRKVSWNCLFNYDKLCYGSAIPTITCWNSEIATQVCAGLWKAYFSTLSTKKKNSPFHMKFVYQSLFLPLFSIFCTHLTLFQFSFFHSFLNNWLLSHPQEGLAYLLFPTTIFIESNCLCFLHKIHKIFNLIYFSIGRLLKA